MLIITTVNLTFNVNFASGILYVLQTLNPCLREFIDTQMILSFHDSLSCFDLQFMFRLESNSVTSDDMGTPIE